LQLEVNENKVVIFSPTKFTNRSPWNLTTDLLTPS